jgi:hypothetical protein
VPMCDICAEPISHAEMSRLTGPEVTAATRAGFMPSRLPGQGVLFGTAGASAAAANATIWLRTVAANSSVDWGVCARCLDEFRSYVRSPGAIATSPYGHRTASQWAAGTARPVAHRLQVSYKCERCGASQSETQIIPDSAHKTAKSIGRVDRFCLRPTTCPSCQWRQLWSPLSSSETAVGCVALTLWVFASAIVGVLGGFLFSNETWEEYSSGHPGPHSDGGASLMASLFIVLALLAVGVALAILVIPILRMRQAGPKPPRGSRGVPEIRLIGPEGQPVGDSYTLCGHRTPARKLSCNKCGTPHLTWDEVLAGRPDLPPAPLTRRPESTPGFTVSSNRMWRCPNCQSVLTKGALGMAVVPGEDISHVSGTGTCDNCHSVFAQSDVYRGLYDLPEEAAPAEPSVEPDAVAVVVVLMRSSRPPENPEDYCRTALGSRYARSRMTSHYVVGHATDLSAAEATVLYRELARAGTLPELHSPIDSFCTVGPEGTRLAVLVFDAAS